VIIVFTNRCANALQAAQSESALYRLLRRAVNESQSLGVLSMQLSQKVACLTIRKFVNLR
jgi:hypothetical protein